MFLLCLMAEMLRLISFAAPGYPPNAVSGATVVAEVRYGPGITTDARILTGDGAFADSALSALRQWKFDAKERGSTTVVIHFRDPNFYSTGPATRTLDPAPGGFTQAYPRSVVEPPYPPNSLAEGSVLLRADLSPEGSVESVETLQDVGGLNESSRAALRQWRFRPPAASSGRIGPASVFVVFVYRRPVGAPARPPGSD